MTACDVCGSDGTFIFPCQDCGDRFCDAHRDPGAHECATPAAEPAAEDGDPRAEGTADGESESIGEPDGAYEDETVEATGPEDEEPAATDEPATDPEPTTRAEAVPDGYGDSPDSAEARGGLRGIPLLGRYFG